MSQENVDAILRGYEAFAQGEIGAVLDLLDDDVVWESIIGPLLGHASIRGKERVKQLLTIDIPQELADFTPMAVSVEDHEDRVLVQSHLTGVGRASGAPVVLDSFGVYEFRDRKIVAFREYSTRAAAIEAEGLAE